MSWGRIIIGLILTGVAALIISRCSGISRAEKDCRKRCYPHICIGYAPNAIICDTTKTIMERE